MSVESFWQIELKETVTDLTDDRTIVINDWYRIDKRFKTLKDAVDYFFVTNLEYDQKFDLIKLIKESDDKFSKFEIQCITYSNGNGKCYKEYAEGMMETFAHFKFLKEDDANITDLQEVVKSYPVLR